MCLNACWCRVPARALLSRFCPQRQAHCARERPRLILLVVPDLIRHPSQRRSHGPRIGSDYPVGIRNFVIASAAKQSRVAYTALDCFAALAMTNEAGALRTKG